MMGDTRVLVLLIRPVPVLHVGLEIVTNYQNGPVR
jgi:hypothetical protein